MKILVVCSEPPFPPRNGVTIPIASYVKMMQEGNELHLALLESGDSDLDPEYVSESQEYFCSTIIVKRAHKSAIFTILGEILFGVPSFHAWEYSQSHDESRAFFKKFDVIFVSPITPLDYAIRNRFSEQRLVAAISDVYTSVLRTDRISTASLPDLASTLINRIRGLWMGRAETSVLRHCDSIIVQTDKDVEWLERIGGTELKRRALSIPNGVNENILEAKRADIAPPQRIVYVTSSFLAQSVYGLEWFIDNVWPKVKKDVPNARFRIVGRGLNRVSNLRCRLNLDDALEYFEFIPEIKEVYSESRVAIAPVFKSYGFMNKVAEALAIGLPVAGDISAFNGLESVLNKGIVCATNDPDQMALFISEMLKNDHLWQEASTLAKKTANECLKWESRKDLLLSTLSHK